jgi:gamma-glutamyltranspeptidase
MDFCRIPYEGLLSKRYAEPRRQLISGESLVRLSARPAGKSMSGFEPVEPQDMTSPVAPYEGDTRYIAVVDQERNAITFTPSLHSGFRTKVVMGELGFVLNCRGDYCSLVRARQCPATGQASATLQERW